MGAPLEEVPEDEPPEELREDELPEDGLPAEEPPDEPPEDEPLEEESLLLPAGVDSLAGFASVLLSDDDAESDLSDDTAPAAPDLESVR